MITWQNKPAATTAQATEPAGNGTGCGCKNNLQHKKLMQWLIVIAYTLLILFLFKKLTN